MTQQQAIKTADIAAEGSGRRLGAKGQRTRQQLIDATVALLETHGLRDVSVVDVARAAQTSPATFYVYFKGVPEAVLAALENASQSSPELEAIIARDWLAPGADTAALAFVECYTDIWNRNRTIFVVRNLAAEEGDPRFYEARMTQARPMMDAISEQVMRAQAAGRTPAQLSPRSCAGTVLMILERLSAIGPMSSHSEGVGYADLKAAAAHSIAMMLGARG
ncbi:AcrR family transcriptional regulator [Sphingopyxis panaciterrae]|uniref:TetR family transcriptional regulator n=1 Tax=Sphingopyxis panaciterrae TaxID=363841 RepID=UPI001422D6E7|nr:TetR family transcriptional regulator [Sphingopyxis panaciterrae]NIJ36780.1 AcrR family transcriptional regulator [Sphingopyxis panaciterrae]